MISLLLDTSYTNLSVGLVKDHELLDKTEYEAWQRQSEYLIQEIDSILSRNGVEKEDIDEIIVSKGPGSYTGVRIAMTVAKVMALALNKSLFSVSSLEVYKNPSKTSICLMNARSKRSYIGIYDGENIILPDQTMTNEEVLKLISEHPDYEICGDTNYLGIEGKLYDVLSNLKDADIERNREKDILAAKPVYLKETYGF